MALIKGIDVSKHQGVINWTKVKDDGVKFALIRAGYTHYEGGLTVDEKFKQNIEGAAKAGIDVGVYVYSYDHSAAAAKTAAGKLLELIKPYKLTYPVIFDMEYEEFNKTTGKGKLNTDICTAFLSEIEKAGYYAMLYASTDFFKNYLDGTRLAKYDKWVAQYGPKCTYSGSYGIWQYSSTGRVGGISGNVDMNWSYREYPELIQKNKLNHLSGSSVSNPTTGKPWIQSYSYTKQADAQAVSTLIKALGYTSYVEPYNKAFRVRVTGFKDYAQAKALADLMNNKRYTEAYAG